MQFTVLLLLLSSAVCLADNSEISLNSSSSNNTAPPKPKPKPPPKPSPFPPPENGDTATVAMAVREAKVYSLGSTVYERFGHALAVYGSSVVVGNARESLYSTVGLFSVQTVKVYGEGDEDEAEEDKDKEEDREEEEDREGEEDKEKEGEPDEGAEEQGEQDEGEEDKPEEGKEDEPEEGKVDAEVSLALPGLVNVTWSQLQAVTLSSEDEDDDSNDDDAFYSGFGKSVALSATALAVGAPYYSSATAGYAAGAVYVFQCQQQQANEEGEEEEREEGEGKDEEGEEEEREEEGKDEKDEEDVEGGAEANEEEDEDREGEEEEDREGEGEGKEGEDRHGEENEDREEDGEQAEGAIIMATGQYQMLVANDSEPAFNTRFGSAVSLLSNTLAVGAPGANTKGRYAGAVYLYTYDEDEEEWREEATLQDDNAGAVYAQFGTSVCLANDATLLAVGASGYSANAMHAGAVFLYNKVSKYMPGNETSENAENATEPEYMWMAQDMLAPSSLSAYSYFGHTIAFRDTIGLVSAFDEDGSGMVYLYQQQQASTATQTSSSTGSVFRGVGPVTALTSLSYTLYTILRPAVSSPADSFGASLVIFHTRDVSNAYKASGQGQVQLVNAYAVAVGAPGAYTGSSSSNTHAGAVYVYLGPHNLTAASGTTAVYSSKWSLMTTSFANDSTAYNAYGSSLALMRAHLLVGAELASTEIASRSGAVYVEANLIPYLVAVTQHNEADEGDVEEEEPQTESNFSAKSFWSFFSTSGGIVTMSFLPIALIAVFFVAHTKSKGQNVLPQHLQCGDSSTGNKGEGSSLVTTKGSQDPEAPVPIEGASNPLVTASNPTATATTSAESTVPELVTEKTPSGWERFLHFLRFPGDTTAHTPLPGSDEQEQQSAEARAADLRLKAPSNAPGAPSGMSIRSPITHIPYHTSLVQSPPGSKAETGTGVQSFRYRSMSETPATDNENLLGKEGAVSAEDIQRLKQQLNAEFQGPAVPPARPSTTADKGNGKPTKPAIRV